MLYLGHGHNGGGRIRDNNRCQSHPECNVLIAGIAESPLVVHLNERLAASPFVTTGSGTESANQSDLKLQNPFFMDRSNSSYYSV